MANAEINPELRLVARFLPRQLVYRWSVPLLRRVRFREGSDDGVRGAGHAPSFTGRRRRSYTITYKSTR